MDQWGRSDGGGKFLSVGEARFAAEKFLVFAAHFVEWMHDAEDRAGGSPALRELHFILAELQGAAARLPANAGGDESDAAIEPVEGTQGARCDRKNARRLAERVTAKMPVNVYCKVFDALDPDDRGAIMTTLDDDLGDIFADVMDGMLLCQAGRHEDAVWHWWFTYWNHWGRHAAHAQTAIWAYLADGNYFD
jgi:hypothetical protein